MGSQRGHGGGRKNGSRGSMHERGVGKEAAHHGDTVSWVQREGRMDGQSSDFGARLPGSDPSCAAPLHMDPGRKALSPSVLQFSCLSDEDGASSWSSA